MAFDLHDQIGDRLIVHPDAVPLFGEASRALFVLDYGPLETDRGSDAMHDFLAWRQANPGRTLGACLREISEAFGASYHATVVSDALIDAQLALEASGQFDFDEDVYVPDETVIASALTQLITEGRVDDDGRPLLAVALARQSHPEVLGRLFGEGRALRRAALEEARALFDLSATKPGARAPRTERKPAGARIAGTRICAPSLPKMVLDGPPTDPERMVLEMMEGGDRTGGMRTSPAGKGHERITEAVFWRLWEAGLELPGFAEIYFRPTTRLPHGTYEVEEGHPSHFFRAVAMGVDPARFRKICRGEANADGVELFAGAVRALVARLELDEAVAEQALAGLREQGLEFDVLLLTKRDHDHELRAYLRFHAKGKDELVLEHRGREGTRRAVAPLETDPVSAVRDLKLVKNVLQVVPAKGSGARILKIPLKDMTG